MLFINLIIPGANPYWQNLGSTLSTGPQFPTSPASQDPYNIMEQNMTFTVTSNSTSQRTYVMGGTDSGLCPWEFNVSGVHGPYWQCVTTADAGGSYVELSSLNPDPYYVGFNTTTSAIPSGAAWYNVTSISAQVQCQNSAVPDYAPLQVQLWTWNNVVNPIVKASLLQSDTPSPGCASPIFHPTLPAWQTMNYTASFRHGLEVSSLDPHELANAEIVVQATTSFPFVAISFVSVTVTYAMFRFNANVACPDINTNPIGYVGCTLDQTWRWISDFFQFLVGGTLNILNWLYAAAVWLFNIFTGFVFGLFYSFIWLMAIPAPYTPPAIIQGGLDILVIAVLGNLMFTFASWMRGVGVAGV